MLNFDERDLLRLLADAGYTETNQKTVDWTTRSACAYLWALAAQGFGVEGWGLVILTRYSKTLGRPFGALAAMWSICECGN